MTFDNHRFSVTISNSPRHINCLCTYGCPVQLLSWHILSYDYHLLWNCDPVVSCPVVYYFKRLEKKLNNREGRSRNSIKAPLPVPMGLNQPSLLMCFWDLFICSVVVLCSCFIKNDWATPCKVRVIYV